MEQLKLVGEDAEIKTGLFRIRYQVEHFGAEIALNGSSLCLRQ